ncbi:MAG: hypothetical protein QG588_863 [Candidatus Poribacteria bacterium]|nr:hypothetical protein [Candidatus Poribacteria bacterium]
MALPIGNTPTLKGKDAVRFSERIKKDLAKPAKLIPTPKIEEARRAVKEYAAKREK